VSKIEFPEDGRHRHGGTRQRVRVEEFSALAPKHLHELAAFGIVLIRLVAGAAVDLAREMADSEEAVHES
jgi:hypothetical protein